MCASHVLILFFIVSFKGENLSSKSSGTSPVKKATGTSGYVAFSKVFICLSASLTGCVCVYEFVCMFVYLSFCLVCVPVLLSHYAYQVYTQQLQTQLAEKEATEIDQ